MKRIFKQDRQCNLAKLILICVSLSLSSCASSKVKDESHDEPGYTSSQNNQNQEPTQEELREGKEQASIAKANTVASAEYHFSMAQAYSSQGNPDRAIEEYKLSIMFDPKSSLIWARLAAEYIKKGMLTSAMEAAKEAVRLEPTFVDARLMLAGLYSTASENGAAVAEYDKVLKQDPTHEEAMVYKAQVLLEEGKVDQAISGLNAFLKRNPKSAMVWYYLGRAEQHLDRFEKSEQAFFKALEVRPDFSQAALSLGYLYESNNRAAKAKEIYEDLYNVNQDVTAANRLATILLRDEKYPEAMVYLEAVRSIEPDNLNAQVKLGLVQMELKQYEAAIKTFKVILSSNPESDRIHYYLGSLYEETKQYDQAVAELKKISVHSQLYEDATLHVTYLLRRNDDEEGAVAHIRDAIKQDSRISSFHIFYASLEEDRDRLPEAVGVLESAVKQFPEHEKIRYYLGSLYDKQGRTDHAIAQMESILDRNPDNADALNYVGYTWAVQGVRLADAEKFLRKALKLKPNNGYILDSWGWYHYVRGDTAKAIIHLERAAALKPDEATILDHLGDVYQAENLREKALKLYQDAMKYAKGKKIREDLSIKIRNLKTAIANGRKFEDERRRPAESADEDLKKKETQPD